MRLRGYSPILPFMDTPHLLQQSDTAPAEEVVREAGAGLYGLLTVAAFVAAAALILLAPFGG